MYPYSPTSTDPESPMKKIGIVGGVAWPSTIDYYRSICQLSWVRHEHQAASGPVPMPEMSIESLNIAKSFAMRGGAVTDDASWAEYDRYFGDALRRLEVGGAGLAIIASSTPHNRYAAITRGIGIPVLSLFDAVAAECERLSVTDLLILGTAPTMDLPVFADVLALKGIRASSPASPGDRSEIVKLINAMYVQRSSNAAERIRHVVDRALPPTGASRTVCLACTELPLAFPEIEPAPSFVVDGVRYLNSTMIHARAAFEMAVQP